MLTQEKLINWLQTELEPYGETVGSTFSGKYDVIVMSGEEGSQHSKLSDSDLYISFEASALYDLINRTFDCSFRTKFTEWLYSQYGYWEFGESWNINIYLGEKV